jgi:Saccharopine dehydrogenase NADP binding domain
MCPALSPSRTVLILGAFGAFGRRIADGLARTTDLAIIAAGRKISGMVGGRVRSQVLDARAIDEAQLMDLNPGILIDAVGPFQGRDRRLARICAKLGIHYVDLADGREFVAGVGTLDDAARQHGALIVSGASTVPALSSAVVEQLAMHFSAVEEIDIGIAPGYQGPRGLATIQAILGYVGRPIPVWRNSRMQVAHGWDGGTKHNYPYPVGARNLALVDVPDTALMPLRYPCLRQLTVRAGLEVPIVHRMLSGLGFLVRVGLIRDLAHHAALLRSIASWFDRAGSGNGAMHVTLRGPRADGAAQSMTWTLVAERGDGPQIPATAAILLAKKLLGVPGYAEIKVRGAMPAVGLLHMEEFEREWQPYAIRTFVTDADDLRERMRSGR